MESNKKPKITIETTVFAPIEKVWEQYNSPEHITNWCAASEDWHAPFAENDFKVGGRSKTTMAAKDGSFSFDFEWTYTKIKNFEEIHYILDDNRMVETSFSKTLDGVNIIQSFDPEDENPIEMQREGWQAILNNFKKYVESH